MIPLILIKQEWQSTSMYYGYFRDKVQVGRVGKSIQPKDDDVSDEWDKAKRLWLVCMFAVMRLVAHDRKKRKPQA